jgi:toxin YoeB
MIVEFTDIAWQDISYWLENDIEKVYKIKELIQSIHQSFDKGLGKPEPLKHEFQGCWSRRINLELRLIYKMEGKKGKNQRCIILQCRYHY